VASARSFARSRARWDPAAQQRLAAHSGGPGALLLCAREHSWAGGLGANAQAPGQAAHVDRLLANSQAGRWPESLRASRGQPSTFGKRRPGELFDLSVILLCMLNYVTYLIKYLN